MQLAPQEIRTFFVTSVTDGRKAIFQSHRMAGILIDVMQQNRKQRRFLLHEFVVMPDHIHLLITPAPAVSLEKAMQYIKGGFSFRAKEFTPVPFGRRALTIIVSVALLITTGTETISIKIRCVEA